MLNASPNLPLAARHDQRLFLVYPLGRRSPGNQEVMFSVFQGMGTFQENGGRKRVRCERCGLGVAV